MHLLLQIEVSGKLLLSHSSAVLSTVWGVQPIIPSLLSLVEVLILLPNSAHKELFIGTVQTPQSYIKEGHSTCDILCFSLVAAD